MSGPIGKDGVHSDYETVEDMGGGFEMISSYEIRDGICWQTHKYQHVDIRKAQKAESTEWRCV